MNLAKTGKGDSSANRPLWDWTFCPRSPPATGGRHAIDAPRNSDPTDTGVLDNLGRLTCVPCPLLRVNALRLSLPEGNGVHRFL